MHSIEDAEHEPTEDEDEEVGQERKKADHN